MLSLNNGWIVGYEQTTNAIVISSSYSMVGEINHLANPQNEQVTKAYFFLNKSAMVHASHMMPTITKKKGTMAAANASIATLSIQFT
jgi:hypothetical protein